MSDSFEGMWAWEHGVDCREFYQYQTWVNFSVIWVQAHQILQNLTNIKYLSIKHKYWQKSITYKTLPPQTVDPPKNIGNISSYHIGSFFSLIANRHGIQCILMRKILVFLKESHFKVVKRIFKHLTRTKCLGLWNQSSVICKFLWYPV